MTNSSARLLAVAVSSVAMAVLASSASAAPERPSKARIGPNYGLFCAKGHVPVSAAKKTALITLVAYDKNGHPRTDFGLRLRVYRGSHYISTKWFADPGCWKAIPVKPNAKPPVLCAVTKTPIAPGPQPYGSCPSPIKDPKDPAQRWEYVFVVIIK